MGLWHPPAVSIDKFSGGFKSTSSYTDLTDTETNDAQNVSYGPNAVLRQRNGSLKILNTKLTTVTGTSGRPITGHYYFEKLGATAGVSVVAAGDSLFSYNSAGATAITTGLTDNSNTFFTFVQIQDPRSASDDMMIATNGADSMKTWNGAGLTTDLCAITSATQVPIAKYILQFRNLIYAANITDSTNVDSPVQVRRSEFGTDGLPNPHRFTEEFFIGGSDKDGQIQGQLDLNNQIVYYTEKSIWLFTPGLGDVNDLQKVIENTGLLAPFSLVSTGNFHIFLTERGVYTFDGTKIAHVSSKINETILKDTNKLQLSKAKGVYREEDNQYILYIPQQGSNKNNIAISFDFDELQWQPLIVGRDVNFISTFQNSTNETKVIYGDYLGYLYEDNRGNNDGVATGFNGTLTSSTINTITDSASMFPTDNDGLAGLLVTIISGAGVDQTNRIISNTSETITFEQDWGVQPTTASTYSVAGIDSYWRSKDYDFAGHDLLKIFRTVIPRIKEVGSWNLCMHYIVDFTSLPQATVAKIAQFVDGMVWCESLWCQTRWCGKQTIKKCISLRNTNEQRLNGNNLALRFSNRRANETFLLRGYDIITKITGRRC